MTAELAFGLADIDPSSVGVDHEVVVDQRTGQATVTVPLRLSSGRNGFGPALTLRFDSTPATSPFGVGWSLDGLLAVSVSTRRRLPTYTADETYSFTLAGDLVPALDASGRPRLTDRPDHVVRYWRARRESEHIRVEEWTHKTTGAVHWRTRDGADVLTVYGADASARIADPADPSRVFAWLAQVQYDPAGNAIRYDYLPETLDGVDLGAAHERSRSAAQAQRYLKQIRYGNSIPLAPEMPEPTQNRWHLRVVFDYGDHATPEPGPDRPWQARLDPRSTYRPGFEVRTHRLCRRIMQFHDFDALGPQPSLVAAYRLGYRGDPAGSALTEIGYSGFRDGAERVVPPLRLSYTEPRVAAAFSDPPSGALINVPAGLTGNYRWLDLLGDGLSGILTETGDAWYYKQNEGGASFGAQQLVAERPAYALGQVSLVDFDADGDPNLAVLHGREAGYYRYDRASESWQGFRPLPSLPHLEAARQRAQWLDVDGDGRAELIVADAERLTVFGSLGTDGFDAPAHAVLPARTTGSEAPFAEDAMLDFFFADMAGDGLGAQVLVRNGRVEYWPQLGHGRFGPPVLMTGSPTFAAAGDFDSARLRLVDVDGSGTADVVYLGEHEVRWWRNTAGNALIEGGRVPAIVDNVSSVAVGDFLGNGMPCLVWSSPLPAALGGLRYLQLTSGESPNLLTEVDNGRGGRVVLSYSSSADHYLADRRAGRPWCTRLPRHVPVVSRHEVIDDIGGGRMVTRFTYHDGVFDADEQLLMFGAVDRFDTEPNAPGATTSCTRTWHHPGTDQVPLTGAYPGHRLVPHVVEDAGGLAARDYERAVASLAGATLREEIYEVGADGRIATDPLSVLQQGYLVRRLQPAAGGRDPAVDQFLAERLLTVHEGDAGDPRVTHELVLDVSSFGTTKLECSIAYPRRGQLETPAQGRMIATVRQVGLLDVDEPDRYDPGVEIERREFELTGIDVGTREVFGYDELSAAVRAAIADPLPFHALAPANQPAMRLIGWGRAYFWDDADQAALPHGQVGSRTRLHHAEEACLTQELAASATGGAVTPAMLSAAGYRSSDGYLWRASDTVHYGDAFDLLARSVRSDGATTVYGYDDARFAAVDMIDPAGNRTVGELDYHLLAPFRVTDPNGTVTEAGYDPLGIAVVTTTRGHVIGAGGGSVVYGQDALAAYSAVPAPDLDTVVTDPNRCVQNASRYVFYEPSPSTAVPPHVVELIREDNTHDGTGAMPVAGRVAVNVTYQDGFARDLQSKRLVEPGDAVLRDAAGDLVLGPDGTPETGPVASRWLVSGHVSYNAKQEPVRRFEPFYSATPHYEPEAELATFGAVHTFGYDAIGRCVRHDAPNATFDRTEYGCWSVTRHDANDTVLDSGYRLLREGLPVDDPERVAYERAAAHANTPVSALLDPLGGEVVSVVRAAPGDTDLVEETRLDVTRSQVEFVDARGLVAFRDVRDMVGRSWRHESIDAGTEVVLHDAFDRPVRRWDARSAHVVTVFDALDRPTAVDVDGRRVEEIDYGDTAPDGVLRNANGLLVRHRDQAGVVDIDAYDPGGQPLRVRRRLTVDHATEPDWSGTVELQSEAHVSERAYDALGRVRREALPDDTVRELSYLASGGLDRVTVSTTDGRLTGRSVLAGAEYNARGERTRASLGNGVTLDHTFDTETFRTSRKLAHRAGAPLTDVSYTYDPVGNVVRTVDAVQQPGAAAAFLTGLNVSAESTFTYDAFYRLTAASGRVHQALLPHDYLPDGEGFKGSRHLHFNNGAAVERYTQRYGYDLAGNLTRLRHHGTSRSWTTDLWISPTSNRSLPAFEPSGAPVVDPESRFDAAGNMTRLDHLRRVDWTYRGCLARAVLIDRGPGQPDDAEYYNYGADGQRVRKVHERLVSGAVEVTEKVYLDGCEIKRIRSGNAVVLERVTSHVADEGGRLAMVHRWRVDDSARETDDVTAVRVRYQLGNHLGSAQLELDETGQVISYEEYLPYGGTAFIAGDAMREVRMRDYRFCGKEADEATGLYYFGHRYFAPWVGRWLSPDPIGQQDGSNLYLYVHDNPISYYDPDGLQTTVTPIDPGKEIVVRQPRVPPKFASVLTRDKWQAFNERKIALMIKDGKPTDVPIEEYREWVRQQNAMGRNVLTVRVTHVNPSRTTGRDGDISAEQARERDKGATRAGGLPMRKTRRLRPAPRSVSPISNPCRLRAQVKRMGHADRPAGQIRVTTGVASSVAKAAHRTPARAGRAARVEAVEARADSARLTVYLEGLGSASAAAYSAARAVAPWRALSAVSPVACQAGRSAASSTARSARRRAGAVSAGGSLPQPSMTASSAFGQGTNAGAGTGAGDRVGQGAGAGARAPGPGTSSGAGNASSRAGGDGGSPNGAPGQGPGGAGGGPRTAMDQATRIAGYANFEFGRRGSPGGGSGGIPGGHGTHSGVGWQLLYIAIGIASLVTLFGGAALKTLFKGIGSLLKRFALAVATLFTRRFWQSLRSLIGRGLRWAGQAFLARFRRGGPGQRTPLLLRLSRFFLEFRHSFGMWRDFRARWGIRSGSKWSMEHMIIKQRWYHGANPVFPPGTVMNRAMQVLGDAGWNVVPVPGRLNTWLYHHPLASMVFNYGTYAAGGYGLYRLWDYALDPLRDDPAAPPPMAAPPATAPAPAGAP